MKGDPQDSGTASIPVASTKVRSDERELVLQCAALPLMALATDLRRSVPASRTPTLRALHEAVEAFELRAADAGCGSREITTASWLLCAWVDEVVSQTPWCVPIASTKVGSAHGAGLLARLHGETRPGQRLPNLIEQLLGDPRSDRGLMRLVHSCLSLGMLDDGSTLPDGASPSESFRRRLHERLQLAEAKGMPRAGHLAWVPAVPVLDSWSQRWVWAGLAVCAAAAFAVYAALWMDLASRSTSVFGSMRALAQRTRLPADLPKTAGQTVVRTAPALAPRLPGLDVVDEAHRSRIRLVADGWLEPEGLQFKSEAAQRLSHITDVIRAASDGSSEPSGLSRSRSMVRVLSWSDDRIPPTLLLPSAWHRSRHWSHLFAEELKQRLPEFEVTAEAMGALQEPSRGRVSHSGNEPDSLLKVNDASATLTGASGRIEIEWLP